MPTLEDARAALQATFGYPVFRPLQEEIVGAILRGEDVFVLMPTGGGKSLCYQLPALLLEGATVVVSPLIALMKDQVDALQALGVPATFINSSLDSGEVGRRQGALARGDVKIVYVAPERLMQPRFLRLLSSTRIALFAIDEAHCISEWGHDFRPEYRGLAQVRALFPSTSLGAFTATATPRVKSDIVAQLGLEQAAHFRGSFNRPNLFYAVQHKVNGDQQLVDYLRDRRQASGIVYCQSRAETERVAGHLERAGYNAAAYHAGLPSEERRRRQDSFIRDETQIMVATIAFGMGIDKPDVRFVVHYDLPRSLEGYYQESGRAGRDGDPSDCTLFYSAADAAKQHYFVDQKTSDRERDVALRQLRQMTAWAEGGFCRRRLLLEYFDEQLDANPARCCDLCENPPELADYTVPSQMLLSCALRTGQRFGNGHLIDVLRGASTERIRRLGHDRLSTYGIGRDRSKEEWQHIARQLLQAGYTHQAEDDFGSVKVTERGKAVLFGGEPAHLPVPRGRPSSRPSVLSELPQTNQLLFERLRALRKRVAEERGVPPYVVFHDSVLREMAARLPRTREELLSISGVGAHKAELSGGMFLDCIGDFAAETGAHPVPLPASAPPSASAARPAGSALSPTARTTLQLFRDGHDIAAIAAARSLALSTVAGHLAEAIECGDLTDLGGLVEGERQRAIDAAIEEVGADRLAPIRERLGDTFSYEEIRLARAAYARRARS